MGLLQFPKSHVSVVFGLGDLTVELFKLFTLSFHFYFQVNSYGVNIVHDIGYVTNILLPLLENLIHHFDLSHLPKLLILHPLQLLLL